MTKTSKHDAAVKRCVAHAKGKWGVGWDNLSMTQRNGAVALAALHTLSFRDGDEEWQHAADFADAVLNWKY